MAQPIDNCDVSQPIYPEVDIALLQGGEPSVAPTGPTYSNPNFGIPNDQAQPEVDVSLLPGVPGQRGPTGPTGVIGATAPITYDSHTRTVGINQSQIQIDATQVSNLPSVTTFVYTQNSLSSTWDIIHNLGYYPQVVVQDSAGTTIEGAVTYISFNELQIDFVAHGAPIPVSGTAYLS